MDKEKATRILSKELGDKIGRITVVESPYKDSLIKNASAVYQIENLFFLEFRENRFFIPNSRYGEDSLTELVLKHSPSFIDANYFFLETIHMQGHEYGDNRSRFAVTPYALIGDKEKSASRKIFYQNVHPKIAYAMEVLEIGNFIGFYKNYKDSSFDPAMPIALKILNEDLEVIKKFIDIASNLEYDGDEEIGKGVFGQFGGIGSLNSRLTRLDMTTLIEDSPIHPEGYVHRSSVSNVVKQLLEFMGSNTRTMKKYKTPLLNEFIDFVFFSLPCEEQNVRSNKHILKNSSNLDFVVAVLSKEYSNGKYFQEYFEVLGKEVQEKVVESLKTLPDRKILHDSLLWSKGFKDLGLDYLNIYKENAGLFIEYFSQRSVNEKKAIIRDIMNCDFINEDVVGWLNQNEAELLREVSFNG